MGGGVGGWNWVLRSFFVNFWRCLFSLFGIFEVLLWRRIITPRSGEAK